MIQHLFACFVRRRHSCSLTRRILSVNRTFVTSFNLACDMLEKFNGQGQLRAGATSKQEQK